jgi:hypothetical protein
VKRKRIIVGILAAGLTLAAAFGTLGYGRIASSAHSFQHYFRAMQAGTSLGLVERFVYSLVLAHEQPAHAPKPRT